MILPVASLSSHSVSSEAPFKMRSSEEAIGLGNGIKALGITRVIPSVLEVSGFEPSP